MTHFPHISFAAATDVGKKRTNNEDSYGVFPEIGVFCVADGMGGGDDGEVASLAAVKAIEQFAQTNPFPKMAAYPIESIVARLRNSVNCSSRWIYQRAHEKHLKGCGSTFVGVCFDAAKPKEAKILHAGDSRLYLIRGRSIYQKTKDHSAVELIGAKNEDEINPMFRGMILRAVGIQETVELDCTSLSLKPGDKILICSDGLTKMLPDKKICSLIREAHDENEAVKILVEAANDAGGCDNITAIVINVGDFPNPLPVVEMPFAELASVDGDSAASCGATQEKNNTNSISFDFETSSGKSQTAAGQDTSISQTNSTVNIFEDEARVTEDCPLSADKNSPMDNKNPVKITSAGKIHLVVKKLGEKGFWLCGILGVLVLIVGASVISAVVCFDSEEFPIESAEETELIVGDDNIHFITSNSVLQTEARAAELERRRPEEAEKLAAIDKLVDVSCNFSVESSFIRKMKHIGALSSDRDLDALITSFRLMHNIKTRNEKIVASSNLIGQIQIFIPKVAEYAEIKIQENRRAASIGDEKYQDLLNGEIAKMEELILCINNVKGKNTSDSQMYDACALLIRMLPMWIEN